MARQATPPSGLFKGRNFMTHDIEAYYELPDGQWAELSTGTGFRGDRIWGVTVRPDPTKLSKMFHSKAAARWYIEELSGDHEEAEAIPPCAKVMKCLCAAHAKGRSAEGPCDANEQVEP